MLQFLISQVVHSFKAPRAAARQIIERVNGPEEVTIVFVLAFCLQAFIMVLLALISGDFEGGAISSVLGSLLVNIVTFVLLVGIVFGVGRLFGGQGTLLEVAAVIAWHSLITVIFAPFMTPVASAETTGGASFHPIVFIIMVVVFWLLVNFITEVHRFESVWQVTGVTLGVLMAIGLVLSILIFGAISGA